ncbi:MAG: ABC transporter transmembrane domain-containing protein [Xenococcaceae cyanobacterium]
MQAEANSQINSEILSWLKQQLQSYGTDSSLIDNFSENFEIIECQLGDCLLDLTSPTSAPNGQQQNNNRYFYLICQGRVRVISKENGQLRGVCTQVLAETETFGDDVLYEREYLPYQAIAADRVIAARFPLEKLPPILQQSSSLYQKLYAAVRTRQTLIFFKTSTELSSVSSHRLQQLVPYLRQQKIVAGEEVGSKTERNGRFWLFKGEIDNHILKVGSAWGYPEPVPVDWKAKTDLLVYQLPKQNWQEACEIIPALDKTNKTKSAPRPNPIAPKNFQTNGAIQPIARDNGAESALVANGSQSNGAIAPVQPKQSSPVFPRPPEKWNRNWFARYPFIEQQSQADCGAACLSMVSRYWGKNFSINWLRELAKVGRSGSSLKNLGKAAEALGFESRPVRASLSKLAEQRNPWIAHWGGDHYVVVYKVKGDRLLVADPGLGKQFYTREKFLEGWTGYALLLSPTGQLATTPEQKQSFGRFLSLLTPYRSIALQIILASLLIQIFGIVTPLFTQIILDQVVVSKSLNTLNVFAIGLVLFGIWNIGLTAVRQYLVSYLSNRLDLTMIGGFIRHTLMLPLKFFELRHVGDIITRVQENQKIQQFLISKVVLAWLDFVMGFVYLGLMLYYNWRLTLLIVGLIPPILLITLGATPLLRKISREVFARSAEQNSALVETITGINTVKATASERELRWRWEERLTAFLNAQFRSQKLGIKLQAASGLINSLGSTALLWYGANLVINDELSIGQFVAFNMLISKVIEPVLSLSNLWDEMQEVMVSVERLDDVLSEEPEEHSEKQLLILPPIAGEVRVENMTFAYGSDEERNTLQNISFTAKPGETIAVVGRSGSGKSTLVKLLEGLYYPTSGHIWIDGHDIKNVSPQSLRSQIGVVPQDCYLFSGTILDNITLYRSDYTLEQAIEAAKLAEAHSFVQSMPLGYNTKVGERGTNFSGGQRQRIAIARALLGEPRILILDEATSSLDTESERRFQDNLSRISRDRTTFIIAHRLSTVRNADCILVLDRGILVQQGNHQQLMSDRQGLYYHLAQQQLAL